MEDNKPDVFLTLEALAEAGVDADIQIAADGEEAIQWMDNADEDEAIPCPDFVILDLNLPRRNGHAVLQHLRRSRRCARALVLVATSSDSPRDREAVRNLGAEGYFRKPSDYDEYKKLGTLVKAMLAGISQA